MTESSVHDLGWLWRELSGCHLGKYVTQIFFIDFDTLLKCHLKCPKKLWFRNTGVFFTFFADPIKISMKL